MSNDNKRGIAVYFTGANASGKTTLLSLFAHAVKEAGYGDIEIINPEEPLDAIRDKWKNITKNVHPDIHIEAHELYGDMTLISKTALNAQKEVFDKIVDFLESPQTTLDCSVLRQNLIADIKKVNGG